MPFTVLQCLFLGVAGLLWATSPDTLIPPIGWRAHFGGSLWFLGAMLGLGCGRWMLRTGKRNVGD